VNQRERNSLDRYITGNYGEDQFREGDEEARPETTEPEPEEEKA
jgi:hypothetical protein